MKEVKFDAQSEDECKHNFALVLDAFRKNNIKRVCPRLLFHLLQTKFYVSVVLSDRQLLQECHHLPTSLF